MPLRGMDLIVSVDSPRRVPPLEGSHFEFLVLSAAAQLQQQQSLPGLRIPVIITCWLCDILGAIATHYHTHIARQEAAQEATPSIRKPLFPRFVLRRATRDLKRRTSLSLTTAQRMSHFLSGLVFELLLFALFGCT